MRRIPSIFIVLALLFVSAYATAMEEPSLRSYVDRNSIRIGDRIKYTIEASAGPNMEIAFTKFETNHIGDFEIKDSGERVKKGLFGKRVTIYKWYSITDYSAGRHAIPAAEIQYKQKGGKEWSVKKTGEIKIAVTSVLPKDGKASDIKDIKGPLYFYDVKRLMLILFSLAALFSAAGLVVYKKLKKRPIPKLPHEITLEELRKIRGFLSTAEGVKEFYFRISDCVRRYIETVFKLRAPEMTTEEFLVSLGDSRSLSAAHKGLLKEFLEACDLVKFAKYAPQKNEIENIFTKAENFIMETKRDVRI